MPTLRSWTISLLLLITPAVLWGVDQPREKRVKVRSVEIDGAKAVSVSSVQGWLGVKEGGAYSMREIRNQLPRILEEYKQQGYPFASVDSVGFRYSPDSSAAEVEVDITEGRLTKVGAVALHGLDQEWTDRLLRDFDTRPGRVFDEITLQQDVEVVLEELENNGFPFAQVTLGEIQFVESDDDCLADIVLDVVSGPRVIVEEIRVHGNNYTKKNVITRESRLKLGGLYDHRKVSRVPAHLRRLEFIDSVDEPTVFLSNDDEGGVLIRLKEGKASKIDGVLGYNPSTGGEKGYFTGLLDLSLGNLFGTGRSIQAKWHKRDQKSQELRLYYLEPWLLGSPINIGGGFEQIIQDTTYVQRDLTLDLSLPLTESLTSFVNLGRSEVHPDSIGSALFGIPRSRTWIAAAGIDYDTRDDRLNPRRGLRYQTSLRVGIKKNFGPADVIEAYQLKTNVDNKKVLIDFEMYAPLFRYQVVGLALHGGQITSDEPRVPITDQFRFGGARTLRGYREKQFRGSKVAWASLEYRYLLARHSRVFVFLDSGYYWRREEAGGTVEAYKLGYGFGIRLETGLGIIGVDYGLGEGDGVFAGKVHVGLVNEF